jgi:hypothetical protein
VTVQEWSAYWGELYGIDAPVVTEVVPGASIGSVGDHHKRVSLTGPCKVDWRDGLRDMAAHWFPDRPMVK